MFNQLVLRMFSKKDEGGKRDKARRTVRPRSAEGRRNRVHKGWSEKRVISAHQLRQAELFPDVVAREVLDDVKWVAIALI